MGQVTLGEVGEDFCLFGWDAGDFLGQFLNLADQVLLPPKVLVRIRRRQV